jgi:hypothetical protein
LFRDSLGRCAGRTHGLGRSHFHRGLRERFGASGRQGRRDTADGAGATAAGGFGERNRLGTDR